MKKRWLTPHKLASLADETPEGRSIVILAKQRFNLRERDVQSLHATFVPFTAQSRMSGISIDNRMIRKGSVDAIRRHVEANGGHFPTDVDQKSRSGCASGGHAAGGGGRFPCAGRYCAERYRQRRY